jgi:type I restriction-modification system DNA methylase subunit
MSGNKAARDFAEYWKGKGYEKGESQPFWISLLHDVYGVEHPEQYIKFETQVLIDHTSFIDGYIEDTKVLIEQKKLDKNLRAAIKQSDGSLLTPFEQAKRYIVNLPKSKHPDYVVTCNFSSFLIYDMENPTGEPEEVFLKDLETDYYRLSFLVDKANPHLKKEMELSIKAGDIVGLIYDALYEQYKDPTNTDSLKSLNMLCVRLVFCLYAEDAGIFGGHGMFHDYLARFEARDIRRALIDLFKVLDTKIEERDPYLDKSLSAFPYVNGGLFKDEDIEIPQFTDGIKTLLLTKASDDFDWSEISPTIFGAVFESTLNPQTRRSGGMHYTSIENIHKAIDPLFLDDLKAEYDEIADIQVEKTKKSKFEAFQKKLSDLKWLDPACGSGNFLTETYISIRRLENQVIRAILDCDKKQVEGQIILGDNGNLNLIKVSISQFYGIEINDFAVTVAKTALWIAESQMMKKTEDVVHMQLDFLPLKTNANIAEGNALHMEWEDVIAKEELNYIMGNPPFVGARIMSESQKKDLNAVFGAWKNVGNLDYVCCWYKKASDYMKKTNIRAALVSTNSVSQGETVANLWKPLFKAGVHIDFAHRTFRWDSEAKIKAHVHCVIIGFSLAPNTKPCQLYNLEHMQVVNNINGYLVDADDIFVESRNKPLCSVPELITGCQRLDDDNFMFTDEEKIDFIAKEPLSKKYFYQWYGAEEFIKNKLRWCLYIGQATPADLNKMPHVKDIVSKVKDYRLQSNRAQTKKYADYPTKFYLEVIPTSNYIAIPVVSSEKRRYIPMGFLGTNVLCSNQLNMIPNAQIYHLGVLSSNVHMAWVRAVCGRLEMRYRYSKDVVYNNFPWPTPTDEQKKKIEKTAQGILDARTLYSDSSLADLYDPLTMPPEILKAHQANDKAVMEAYGFTKGSEEYRSSSACVAALFRMYKELTENPLTK